MFQCLVEIILLALRAMRLGCGNRSAAQKCVVDTGVGGALVFAEKGNRFRPPASTGASHAACARARARLFGKVIAARAGVIHLRQSQLLPEQCAPLRPQGLPQGNQDRRRANAGVHWSLGLTITRQLGQGGKRHRPQEEGRRCHRTH